MTIAFNTIPLIINTPGSYIEYDTSRAVHGLQIQPHDVLLVGNKTATGTATSGAVLPVPSADDALVLFGTDSQLYQMVKQYKAVDRLTPVWAIPLTDLMGGVAAIHRWTVTGTATAAGEIAFYLSGRRFTVPIIVNETAAQVVTAAVAAAALLTDTPATVTDGGTGFLTATAIHKGVFSNQIKLGVNLNAGEAMPAGLAIAISAPTAGSGDTDHAAAVTAMGEDQYNTMAVGVYSLTEIAKIVTELESRESAMRCIEGVVFGAVCDSAANLATYAASLNTSILCVTGYEASASCLTPWEVAAQVAAVNAASVQVDPARHQSGTSLSGAYAAARGTRFTRAQRDTLLGLGISTIRASSDGRMLVDRLVTTKITNSSGLSDLALFDLSPHVRTIHAIRYTIRARIASKFAYFKLADDDGIARPKVATPSVIRGELVALFWEWFYAGWVENPDQYMADLLVERDGSDVNRVNAIIPPDIINSFLVFAGQISFIR